MNKQIHNDQINEEKIAEIKTTLKSKEDQINKDKIAETKKLLKNKEVQEFLSLSKSEAIKTCLEWNEEVNSGKVLKTDEATQCPIYQWVIFNNAKCHREMVPNTAVCPLCGRPVCPDCMNHNVDIISRVTGYLSTVSGWNTSKKQEFEDRNRYNLDVMGRPATNVNR